MRRPKFERQASPTRGIKQLPLQAQLSRVKMSETPSQTSHDRNLSEGSVVGPYTIEFPASVTAKDGFQQTPIPSRSAAAFFAAGRGYFSFWWHGSRCEAAARILEHRPQRCGDARPFAGPPSSGRRNSACGVCTAAVGGGYRVIDLALAERSTRLYRRLRGEANRSGSADLEQGARPKSASRLTLTLRSRSSNRSSGELR